ncbi:MAG: DUF493 domain-containing protein [Lentisphaerae bacterium]|nr:DUF493 domain-containing protein [Lentisphaerota bacterium]
MKNNSEKIKFPCRWEFRVITDGSLTARSRAAVAGIGEQENVALEITDGESSGGGKYTALRVAGEVVSLEQARELAKLFSRAEGVRFVL